MASGRRNTSSHCKCRVRSPSKHILHGRCKSSLAICAIEIPLRHWHRRRVGVVERGGGWEGGRGVGAHFTNNYDVTRTQGDRKLAPLSPLEHENNNSIRRRNSFACRAWSSPRLAEREKLKGNVGRREGREGNEGGRGCEVRNVGQTPVPRLNPCCVGRRRSVPRNRSEPSLIIYWRLTEIK